MDVESVVTDAFTHLGVEVRTPVGAPDAPVDLVLEIDGLPIEVELKRRSLVDATVAERLLAEVKPSESLLLIVGDRVTAEARGQLLAARAGYLDLRGHLGARTRGILIDADVPSVKDDQERADPLAGRASLEIATHLMISPRQPVSVRALARDLGRSPSTVSEILAALRRDGLVDDSNAIVDSGLFWRVSDKWRGRRTFVRTAPDEANQLMTRTLRLGRDDVEAPGWALTDTAAAAAYGAPVAYRAGQQRDFFVPDESVLHRAVRLLDAASSAEASALSLRVAPVRAATSHRIELAGPWEWPLAHPLFVALDLAQDTGRGREILDAWTPDERWTRVW